MFKKNRIGISFSDEAIFFVKLTKSWGKFRIEHFGEKKLPSGIIKYGIVKDADALSEILRSLKREEKLDSVFISLPEVKDNISADYLRDFREVFSSAHISVNEFESEGEAIGRAVIKKDDEKVYMVVNIGESQTGIFVMANASVLFSLYIDVEGETIVKITDENIIRENGFSRSMITAQVSSAMVSGIHILREEIGKCFTHWHTRGEGKGVKSNMIGKIILTGRDAHLKGIAEYISVGLKTKVELANVWVNILHPAKNIPAMSFKESLSYAPAIGSALRGFE